MRVDDAEVGELEHVRFPICLSVQIDRLLEWMEERSGLVAISVIENLNDPAKKLPRSGWQFNNSFVEIFEIAKICPGD